MTIVARTNEHGVPGYMAHPEGARRRPGILMVLHAHGVTADHKIDAYQLATLGFNVFVSSLFNMFGVSGTSHIGRGADLQAKHSDGKFLEKMSEAWRYLTERMNSDPARTAAIGHCMGGSTLTIMQGWYAGSPRSSSYAASIALRSSVSTTSLTKRAR